MIINPKPLELEAREELIPRSRSEHRTTEASGDRIRERDRDSERGERGIGIG